VDPCGSAAAGIKSQHSSQDLNPSSSSSSSSSNSPHILQGDVLLSLHTGDGTYAIACDGTIALTPSLSSDVNSSRSSQAELAKWSLHGEVSTAGSQDSSNGTADSQRGALVNSRHSNTPAMMQRVLFGWCTSGRHVGEVIGATVLRQGTVHHLRLR